MGRRSGGMLRAAAAICQAEWRSGVIGSLAAAAAARIHLGKTLMLVFR